MKAVIFSEPNKFSVEERSIPSVGELDALIRVHACGICGTDIHILHGEHIVRFPVIPGHEFSGEVAEVGSRVTGVKVGDRVTVDPNIVDRTCFFCKRGEINLCENLTAVGVNYNGGFAEYASVPAEQVYLIPENVSLDEAALAEPLSCCIHGMDRAGVCTGDTVLVLGAGGIGLILIQLARAAGAGRILVSEPDPGKRKLAALFGAGELIDPSSEDVLQRVFNITRVGADVVIESAGRKETAEMAPKLARRGGTVLQFGVVSPDKMVSLAPYDIFYRELKITGSFVNPFTHARAVEMLSTKQVDVLPVISHRFALENISEALRVAQSRDAIKVLVMSQTG